MADAAFSWDVDADLVVAGSGGGGLTAAVVAHTLGLRPLLLESADRLGGATALAAGGIWIPLNDAMRAAGQPDERDAAVEYLLALSDGAASPETREVVQAYVDNAAPMVRHLEQHSPLRFEPALDFPDYRMDLPGARTGRVMTPGLFDARQLGDWLPRVRSSLFYPPIGLHELDNGWRPRQVSREVLQERLRDNIRSGGAAAVAALVRACLDREIALGLNHRVTRLVQQNGRVAGVIAEHEGRSLAIGARRGVVLATGGADWDEQVNRLSLNRPFDRAMSPPWNRGDGQRMAASLGVPLALMHESYWCPAYHLPEQEYDGQPVYRPCVADRCLPHSIVVNRFGRRFVDESLPYNDFVRGGPQRWDPTAYDYPNVPMYLVVDQQFRDRYTLCGIPAGMPTPEWITTAETPSALADALGIDPEGLEAQISAFNAAARAGRDEQYRRGEHGYGRYYSDPLHEPRLRNPSLGALEKPPFYGLRLYVSTFGHKGGPLTNRHAQVLGGDGGPVPGLYAAGNVAASVHQNIGYAGGAMIGRALTFGYLAALHASQEARRSW